jgi:hypothetical protein
LTHIWGVNTNRKCLVIGITTVITVRSVINGLNENVLGGTRESGFRGFAGQRYRRHEAR